MLAVVRAGSLTQAAKALGIDDSTVFRRLRALEERIGVRLFERLPGGAYQTAAAGERMAAAAERMEDEAVALDRDIAGRDHRLSGRLRVTSSETLAYRLVPGSSQRSARRIPASWSSSRSTTACSACRAARPTSLRPVRPREGDLWGRKLADIAWTVYGRRDRLTGRDAPTSIEELDRHPLIGWEDGASRIGAAAWLERVAPDGAIVIPTSSLIGQLVAAEAGIGLAVLPCYLGDPDPDLVRALPSPVAELGTELWIVTHKDLRRTARVRAFFDLVGDGLARERDLFAGRLVDDQSQRGGAL